MISRQSEGKVRFQTASGLAAERNVELTKDSLCGGSSEVTSSSISSSVMLMLRSTQQGLKLTELDDDGEELPPRRRLRTNGVRRINRAFLIRSSGFEDDEINWLSSIFRSVLNSFCHPHHHLIFYLSRVAPPLSQSSFFSPKAERYLFRCESQHRLFHWFISRHITRIKRFMTGNLNRPKCLTVRYRDVS